MSTARNTMLVGLTLAALLVPVAVTSCGGTAPDPQSDDSAFENERTTGNSAVYDRINSLTSCTALQREFDVAMDNAEAREPGDALRDVSLSYASAANTRMREVGCYG